MAIKNLSCSSPTCYFSPSVTFPTPNYSRLFIDEFRGAADFSKQINPRSLHQFRELYLPWTRGCYHSPLFLWKTWCPLNKDVAVDVFICTGMVTNFTLAWTEKPLWIFEAAAFETTSTVKNIHMFFHEEYRKGDFPGCMRDRRWPQGNLSPEYRKQIHFS